jgi:cyclopropane-fatty-acyl-phospholipid synthase
LDQVRTFHRAISSNSSENLLVLSILTGWGTCAILLAQTHGCRRVDTLTLSSEQQTLAQRCIATAGLSHLITVHLMDYRSLPKEWEHQFDRMISIEMYEHVGKNCHQQYWKMVD